MSEGRVAEQETVEKVRLKELKRIVKGKVAEGPVRGTGGTL